MHANFTFFQCRLTRGLTCVTDADAGQRASSAIQATSRCRAVFDKPPRGLPVQALVQLEKHAEFSDSLAGRVQRDLRSAPGGRVAGHAARAQLAGDIEAGTLLLDESSNGINLTASWDGQIVEGSCGHLVKGLWKDLSNEALPDAPDVPFVLTRQTGW